MNSYTANRVATLLGVSRRRLVAASERASIGSITGHQRLFTEKDISLLRSRLGTAPVVASLTRNEVMVLAELSRRPFGLVSSRAVARACGLSPATATKAIHGLLTIGLVVERDEVVPLGHARRVRSLHANVHHPQWGALLPMLRQVVHPAMPGPSPSHRLPAHLRHAFWNVDEDTLTRVTPATDGSFIAVRALTTGDVNLLAYAAATVPASAWTRAGLARGLTDEQRALASSLAGNSPDVDHPA